MEDLTGRIAFEATDDFAPALALLEPTLVAIQHYRQALSLYHDLDNAYEAADTLDRLGHPHAALGDHDRAREVWREARDLYRQQGRDQEAEQVERQLDRLRSDRSHVDGS